MMKRRELLNLGAVTLGCRQADGVSRSMIAETLNFFDR